MVAVVFGLVQANLAAHQHAIWEPEPKPELAVEVVAVAGI